MPIPPADPQTRTPELALRRSEADTAIQGMTRVEVIDGVQVGFKELSSLDLGHRVTEHAYLVVWRQGDRLVSLTDHRADP